MKNYLAGFLTAALLCFLFVSLDREVNARELTKLYYTSCVALPGQVSIMKWVDDRPICKRTEELPQKNMDSIQSWKKFM